MRVLFIGQAPFGAESLAQLISQEENIVGAITIPDVPNQRYPNPVKECAEKHNIPLYQKKYLKDKESLNWVKNLQPDLLVLAFVTTFIPKEMIDCATHGGINYHPSLLPKYRGGSAINWAVISGEEETGVTIHFIDEGVDTGPILLQEKVEIEPDDTVKSLYFKKLYPLGIRLIGEAVKQIRTSQAKPVPQEEEMASFQPVISVKDTIIDWQQPSSIVYNLIRGANPSPGAQTTLHGESVKIFDSMRVEGSGDPGTVVALSEESVDIATGNGIIRAAVFQPAGSKKIAAADFITHVQLKIGETFT